MILVFDVGNSNIVLGIYTGWDLKVSWRISTDHTKTADEYATVLKSLFDLDGCRFTDIKAIVISSVFPPLMPVLEELCQKYFKLEPLVVGPGVKTGLSIRYENPKEVGADRVVNAVAAYELYGGPVIIVDFGTATTFCVVSANGEYLGGVIAPGIEIATEALFRQAAKLPRVELVKPKTVIGKNTVASMQSGILYGFVGQVDGVVERIKAELNSDALVVATGGLAKLIAPDSKTINKVNPYLTLEGLRLIYERNKGWSG